MDVLEDVGDFPCIEVHSPEALSHHVITALQATPGKGSPTPDLEVTREDNRWTVRASGLLATIETTIREPIVTLA
ncbi:MAG: hypothetical protein ACC655_08165 [Rhodothermia bacterium]